MEEVGAGCVITGEETNLLAERSTMRDNFAGGREAGWRAAWKLFILPALVLLPVLLSLPAPARADTVLVTGANSGIGLEFTRQYAAKGWTVIATHRRSSNPQALLEVAKKYDKVRIEHLDVTSEAEATALARRLENVPIDVLLNNAGVYNDRSGCKSGDEECPGDWSTQNFGKLKFSTYDTILAVNVKGPLIVTQTFYPNVKASRQKKIVAISSSNASLTGDLNESAGIIFYRASKSALNRQMQIVARSVKADGVTVVMLNPGATVTERQKNPRNFPGMLPAAETARQMIDTIERVRLEDTGRFLRYDGKPEPW
jgi:NAD(P)-dependent dehydrogenase (short-subunit alcohol dehydrogenase family)